MSEHTLQRFIDRLNTDVAFRESAVADPEGAFAAFGLSTTEQTAITSGDEDALRRLAGVDVTGFLAGSSGMSFTSRCPSPRPTDTPGSGNGCGTGNTHNCPDLRLGLGWR